MRQILSIKYWLRCLTLLRLILMQGGWGGGGVIRKWVPPKSPTQCDHSQGPEGHVRPSCHASRSAVPEWAHSLDARFFITQSHAPSRSARDTRTFPDVPSAILFSLSAPSQLPVRFFLHDWTLRAALDSRPSPLPRPFVSHLHASRGFPREQSSYFRAIVLRELRVINPWDWIPAWLPTLVLLKPNSVMLFVCSQFWLQKTMSLHAVPRIPVF